MERVMPGDPQECRKHALRCADFAHSARTQELKQTLIQLSKSWMKLAIELERAKEILSEFVPDTKKQATRVLTLSEQSPNSDRTLSRAGSNGGSTL
jgi:hypothetical protein